MFITDNFCCCGNKYYIEYNFKSNENFLAPMTCNIYLCNELCIKHIFQLKTIMKGSDFYFCTSYIDNKFITPTLEAIINKIKFVINTSIDIEVLVDNFYKEIKNRLVNTRKEITSKEQIKCLIPT